jgi:hypothetical protein
VQQLAPADAMLAAKGALQLGIQLVDGDGGEKAEAAQVDGEQRDLRLPMARAAESSVPSPPSTITRSQPSGTSSRGCPSSRAA